MASAYDFICRKLIEEPGTPYSFQDIEHAGLRDIMIEYGPNRSNRHERESVARHLCDALRTSLASGEPEPELISQLDRLPLILYASAVPERMRALTDAGIVENDALYRLGMNLVRHSAPSEEVRLGILILALYPNDITDKIVRTLALHSDFTLFAIIAHRFRGDAPRYAAGIAAETIGYGRLAALTEMIPVTEKEQRIFLTLCADSHCAQTTFSMLCFDKPDMAAYLRNAPFEPFQTFSAIIAYACLKDHFFDTQEVHPFIHRYLETPVPEDPTFADIAALCSIMYADGMTDDSASTLSTESRNRLIAIPSHIVADLCAAELADPTETVRLISLTLWVTEHMCHTPPPELVSLIPLFERNPFDYDLLHYTLELHPELYAEGIYESIRFSDDLFSGPDMIDSDGNLPEEFGADLCLEMLIRALSKINMYNESLALKCLHGRYTGVRGAALDYLKANRASWSDSVVPAVSAAKAEEPDSKLKARMNRLSAMPEPPAKARRYVDVKDVLPTVLRTDPEIITTHISGCRYRDLSPVEQLLQEGVILCLVPEPENEHDPSAILVTTMDGYCIGYVPAARTALLHQQYAEGRRLYAVFAGSLSSPRMTVRAMSVVQDGNVTILPFPKE